MNKDITNHTSALDINEIWAAIEPQVDEINAQRKNRKAVFIYWLSGLALLVGLGIAGLFLFGDNFKQSEISNDPLPEPVTQTVAPAVTNEKISPVVKPKATRAAADLETTPAAITTLAPKTKTNEPTLFKNPTVAEKITKETLPISTNITPPESAVNIVMLPDNIGVNNPVSTATPLQKEIEQVSVVSISEEKTTVVSPLTIVGLTAPTTDVPNLSFTINNTKSMLPPPVYIEKPTFSIEFQAGISSVNRTLSSSGERDNALDTLIMLRNLLEDPLEAVHANLLVNAHFPSGFF